MSDIGDSAFNVEVLLASVTEGVLQASLRISRQTEGEEEHAVVIPLSAHIRSAVDYELLYSQYRQQQRELAASSFSFPSASSPMASSRSISSVISTVTNSASVIAAYSAKRILKSTNVEFLSALPMQETIEFPLFFPKRTPKYLRILDGLDGRPSLRATRPRSPAPAPNASSSVPAVPGIRVLEHEEQQHDKDQEESKVDYEEYEEVEEDDEGAEIEQE